MKIFSFSHPFLIAFVLATIINLSFSQPTFSDNCAVFNDVTSACQQCNPGFYLQYFFCIPCNANCACSSKQDFCQSCLPLAYNGLNFHSYLQESSNQCIMCNSSMPYCLECSNLQNCTKCYNGQYLIQQMDLDGMVTRQHCSQNICTQNCQICQNNIKCKQCQPGFYLYPNKTCSSNPCSTNCSVCSSPTQCLTCISGYFLDSKECAPCIANCTQCTNATFCQICEPSLVFQNGTCNSTGLSNCIQYASNQTVCTECEPGYEVTAGSCNPCSGCELCNQPFICLTPCLPGNSPFNFACISNFQSTLWYSLSLMIIFVSLIF